MNNNISSLVQELLELGRDAVKLSSGHKMFEPSMTITWHNDGAIDGEFYSYCLDLSDGGRHHSFGVADEPSLINILQVFIKEAKEEIKKLKEENDEDWADTSSEIEEQELKDMEDTERMENEGG